MTTLDLNDLWVLYNYNLKPEHCGINVTRESERYIKNSRKYGLIADDDVLYEEFPELVYWQVVSGSEPTKNAIDTTSYIGMLHGVVKELVSKVEVLQAQISGSSDYNALKEAVSSSG